MDTAKEIIWNIPKGLLKWYDFRDNSRVLYIGNENDELAEMLREMSLQAECMDAEQAMEAGQTMAADYTMENKCQDNSSEMYDYIISIEKLEEQSDPLQCLTAWKNLLRKSGKLLLGMNNRYGLRYFCGDRDPYTDCNFDGIENYRRFPDRNKGGRGRCYSQSEIRNMLKKAGWPQIKMYSVLPDLKHPQLIYAEDYLPNEELAGRLFPMYHSTDTIFLEEENLYSGLAENGMFHAMANAYLIECSSDGVFSDVRHVTLSVERGRRYALMTIIHGNDTVEKRAVYPEGEEHLKLLSDNLKDLKNHGIAVVDARMENHRLFMPFIKEKTSQVFLKELLFTDQEEFIRQMDRFRDLILSSSEIVEDDRGDGKGAVLRKGYLDLVPLNSFYVNGGYLFYDQEFYMENCPANAIIVRMVRTFYFRNAEMEKVLPSRFFFERYHLMEELDLWNKIGKDFISNIRKNELESYYKQNWRNPETLKSNRKWMNFSADDYYYRFRDIFRNADKRKLIVFGAGKIAKKFIALYRHEYSIHAIIDNNEEKWGQQLDGITIYQPEMLKELQSGEYKVFICIKDFIPIMKQLNQMGATEYAIYEPNEDYPRKRVLKTSYVMGMQPKKYHVGYIAGVFDMFHVGHLNLLKRAKELCDYLIVGVVTDERTERIKKGRKPVIPFEERLEIVRSCRYVDEAVEIPTDYGNTWDAYAVYHFDCQFSGNDHINNPHWIAQKEFLEKHGAEMVYFPYTEGTSSTMLREALQDDSK